MLSSQICYAHNGKIMKLLEHINENNDKINWFNKYSAIKISMTILKNSLPDEFYLKNEIFKKTKEENDKISL